MKKIIMAIILATTALSASAVETTPVEKQITMENSILEDNISTVDGEVFFYLHCRRGINSQGQRYYLWCRNERRVGGVTYITGYLEEKDYPPLKEISFEEEDDQRIPEELIEMGDILEIDPEILKILNGE